MDFLLKQETIYKKAIQSKKVSEIDTIVDTNNNDTIPTNLSELEPDTKSESELESESDTKSEDELMPIEKETIYVECNGETFSYCIGEVLNKELHSVFLSAFKNGDEKYSTPLTYTIHFCIYKINVKGCIPFLEFLLYQNNDKTGNKQPLLQFPQTKVTLSQDAMDNHELIPDELLMGLSNKGIEIGIFPEGMIATTEEIHKYVNGFIEGESNETVSNWNWLWGRSVSVKDIFFFFPIPEDNWKSKTDGQWAILDEIINKKKLNNLSIDPYISHIFYDNPDLMTIYGSDTNFINKKKDSVIKTLESANIQSVSKPTENTGVNESMVVGGKKLKEWNKGYVSKCSKFKVPQETPFCLYLCNDKTELIEENDDDENENENENENKKEDKNDTEIKYLLSSPKEVFKTVSISPEKESLLNRTNHKYGYYYYFTDEPINTIETPQRFAVFAYNTQYVLDENTTQIVKELELEEYFEKKEKKSKRKSKDKNENKIESKDENEDENENENEKIYDSIYFQQDEIPVWCIKHRECIVEL